MLTINNRNVVKGLFPNNEVDYIPVSEVLPWSTTAPHGGRSFTFKLVFESNIDLFNLMVMSKAVDDKYKNSYKRLFINFFPYEQMDREMDSHLFSLKYVARLINDCNFSEVIILDPHSNVLPALLNNVEVSYPELIAIACGAYDLFFYPDNGAAKKYSEVYDSPYRFGNKRRNLDTGEIVSYDVIASREDIKGKKILIVDDLVMGGRTFTEAAKALKEMGAAQVDLHVTHVMPQAKDFWNSKGNGWIDNLYTADTLDVVEGFKLRQKP